MSSSPARHAVELISSMRFAISLLSFLAMASVIGTILKQNEPYNNYLNQFGQFWFAVFEALSLYGVYNAWWFVLILAFLVTSTSLCVYRNAPKMFAQMRTFKESMREQSFAAFAHHTAFTAVPADGVARAETVLRDAGFKTKTAVGTGATMVAAKAGSANRLGYVFAHVGIIVICIGGLLDGDLLLRAQMAFGGKEAIRGNPLISDIPEQSRLTAANPSFRGNILIPEGSGRDFALLNYADGILLQPLPFKLDLKRFVIEHYPTGQPKLFASDVLVTNKDDGRTFEARIEVNKPLIHRGVAVYQSSFDDGGTKVSLKGFPVSGARDYSFTVAGEIGGATLLTPDAADKSLTLEFTGFRLFNVERVGESGPPREPTFADKLKQGMGPGSAPGKEKEMRNVGPSITYKLRDAAGQAKEFHNYMLPMFLDGRQMLLSGVRENTNDTFRYLRLPMDREGSLADFMRLRAAVFDPELQGRAGGAFARELKGNNVTDTLRKQLAESGRRALEAFAVQGFQAVADFLEKSVPEAEREKAAEVYVRLLNSAAFEAWQLKREKDGLPRQEFDETNARFVQDSLNAVSDSFFYGAPVYLHLNSFDEVKASVFQLTRSPGKNIVYLGSLLLVLGVFAMLYIRERRAWVMVKSDGTALFAMSALRRGVDDDREFNQLREKLRQHLGGGQPSAAAPA